MYLTTEDTAKILLISKKTLERMRCNGNGPTYIKAGRRVLYSQEDVDIWINENKRKSTSQIIN